jgi:hypothetical protein
MPLALPPQLAKPVVIDDEVAFRVMLDLTVYLIGPSVPELERLLDIYEAACPKGRLAKYTTGELPDWYPVSSPVLTDSGEVAAKAGIKRPYFEPSRRHINAGRGFKLGYWDGRPISDPEGSWSFSCGAVLLEDEGIRGVARVLMPLDTELGVLRKLAADFADAARFHAGHGGLVFVYHPEMKEPAFDEIYALGRRYWGIDIEDLDATMPFSGDGIKDVNWVTMVGTGWLKDGQVETGIGALRGSTAVSVDPHAHGVVLVAGQQPVVGDQNRPDRSLDPYVAVAKALEPLFLTEHPDFDGVKFPTNDNTLGWIRRFIEPDGWR